jgi:hypothetical protein
VRPKRRSSLLLGLATLGAALAGIPGCDDSTSVEFVHIDSTVVASSTATPDPARTYEYDLAEVRPDSVLSALWIAGLPVEVAWLPVDYRCDDIRGPRLTVQLTAPDTPRMAAHDFTPGTGRLMCAEKLVRYVITSHRR